MTHAPIGTRREGGQQVGHPKVRETYSDVLCGSGAVCLGQSEHQDVGGPQVPVQDAQGVQVQQARGHLQSYR